jgi:hypothetical protein
MAEQAAHLVAEMIPAVLVRQWVLLSLGIEPGWPVRSCFSLPGKPTPSHTRKVGLRKRTVAKLAAWLARQGDARANAALRQLEAVEAHGDVDRAYAASVQAGILKSDAAVIAPCLMQCAPCARERAPCGLTELPECRECCANPSQLTAERVREADGGPLPSTTVTCCRHRRQRRSRRWAPDISAC